MASRTSFVATGSNGYRGISLREQLGRPWNFPSEAMFTHSCHVLVQFRDLCNEMLSRALYADVPGVLEDSARRGDNRKEAFATCFRRFAKEYFAISSRSEFFFERREKGDLGILQLSIHVMVLLSHSVNLGRYIFVISC